MRSIGRAGTLLGLIVLVGCGVAPAPAEEMAALDKWSGSATYSENGTVITATYADWPLPIAPDVFACAKPPTEVYGPGPENRLLLPDDPSCVRFQTALGGRTLRTSLDRATLPAAFTGRDSWSVVLAKATPVGHWTITKTLPADFPGP